MTKFTIIMSLLAITCIVLGMLVAEYRDQKWRERIIREYHDCVTGHGQPDQARINSCKNIVIESL